MESRQIDAQSGRELYLRVMQPSSGPHEVHVPELDITETWAHAAPGGSLHAFIVGRGYFNNVEGLRLECEGASVTDEFRVVKADTGYTVKHVAIPAWR